MSNDWMAIRRRVETDYAEYLARVDEMNDLGAYDCKYPHCDDLVLHAPGACEFCDEHPERQALREQMKINFTGQNREGYRQCPAEACRPVEKIELWDGNIPETEQTKAARKAYFKEIDKILKRYPFRG